MPGFYYEALIEINDKLISMKHDIDQVRADFYYFYDRIYVGDECVSNDGLVEKVNNQEATIGTLWLMIMLLLAMNIGTIFFMIVSR